MAKIPTTPEVASQAEIQREMRTLRSELNNLVARGELNGAKCTELATGYVDHLPTELKNKVKDTEGLVSKIASILGGIDSSGDRVLQQQELDSAITNIGLSLIGHLNENVTLSIQLPKGETVPNVDRQVLATDSRTRLRVKSLAGTVTMALSGLTSFMAGYTWTGKGAEAAVSAYPWLEQFEAINDPTVRTCINTIGGILGGIVITQAALSNFRNGTEEISYRDNVGFFSAARRNLGKMWRANALGATLALGALSVDVMTNADGIVSLTAGNVDEAKQIHEAKQTIGDAITATREHLKNLPGQVASQADAAAQDLLAKEAGGKSESGAAGKGPIYGGKAALVGGDATVTIPTTPIGNDVRQALSVTDLDNDAFPTIGKHLSTVVTDTAKPVEGLLKEIEDKVKTLDAGQNVEVNQSVLKGIKARFDKIQDILKKDGQVETKLQEVLKEYNEAFAEIGKVAQKHYPSYTAGSLANMPLPELTLTLPQVEVKSFEWKSSINLINELITKGELGMALFWMAASLIGGILSSYGDEILDELTPEGRLLGKRVRSSHKEDKENTEEGAENLEKIRKARIASLHALLNGPFGDLLHSKAIHPGLIAEALDAEIDSILNPDTNPLPQEVSSLRAQIARLCGDTWTSIIGNPINTYITSPLAETWTTLGTGNTKEVNDFNRKVSAYKRTASPQGLLNVLARILKSTKKNQVEAVKENDKHIETENIRLITAELTTLRDNMQGEIPAVAANSEYRTQITTILSDASRNLEELTDVNTYGIATMATEKANLKSLYETLIQEGMASLHQSLIETSNGIQLTDKIDEKEVITAESIARAQREAENLQAELKAISNWDRGIFNASVFTANHSIASSKRTGTILEQKLTQITEEKRLLETRQAQEEARKARILAAREEENAHERLLATLEELLQGKEDAPKIRANRLLTSFFQSISPIVNVRKDDSETNLIENTITKLVATLNEIYTAAELNGDMGKKDRISLLKNFLVQERDNLLKWIVREKTKP